MSMYKKQQNAKSYILSPATITSETVKLTNQNAGKSTVIWKFILKYDSRKLVSKVVVVAV